MQLLRRVQDTRIEVYRVTGRKARGFRVQMAGSKSPNWTRESDLPGVICEPFDSSPPKTPTSEGETTNKRAVMKHRYCRGKGKGTSVRAHVGVSWRSGYAYNEAKRICVRPDEEKRNSGSSCNNRSREESCAPPR